MIKRTIAFSPPDITEAEIEEVGKVLRSGWITTGPKTKEFEKRIAEYCNVNRAVCLNSATACLESMLRLLGVGEGDEVIVPAYTYTATVSPVCHVGAKPVMVDTANDSFEMDYNQLEKSITEKTKVIIPVDIAGVMCDYEQIFSIVEQNRNKFSSKNDLQKAFGRIIVVADAAHAFGAVRDGKKCGEMADFTSFSFHAVKNLTTAEGGALTWKPIDGIDDDWIYQQFMLLSLHGQSKDALEKTKIGSWEYDIASPAYKCNMTDIMASIGLIQLGRYPELLLRRKEIIRRYDGAFRSLGICTVSHYSENEQSSGHLYLMRIPGITEKQRNGLIIWLAEQGIVTNVHYKPLPMMTAYQNMGFFIKNYPNAYLQYQNEITLPLHTKLTEDDIAYIIETVKKQVQVR